MQQLPISIQTFEDMRNQNLIYVDKTAHIHQLVEFGKYYFFARPRRFGKSMLLTTLKAYFQGKKELFEDLYIYDKEENWTVYPVIHIDYSLVDYKLGVDIFVKTLLFHLRTIAAVYDVKLENNEVASCIVELVEKLKAKFNQKVVILVDEYDKPMIDVLDNEEKFNENRNILRTLYTNFKGLDASLRFVMLTGVSRFAKVGVFSGMNNLDDISNEDAFGTMVGFTQTELEANFEPYIVALGKKFQLSRPDLLQLVKRWYNGFSFDGVNKLYNPFSVLALFKKLQFENYWFSTGTPTFLIDLIKRQKHLPENFEGIKVSDLVGNSMQMHDFPLVPLLYQTGYLSMQKKEWDGFQNVYYLDYPNFEVKHSFLTYITASFKQVDEFVIQPQTLALRDTLREERIDDFIRLLTSFLADIPARLHIPKEAYYHSITYLILRIVGFQPLLEKETDKGRIDAVIELKDKYYIIEFKFAHGTKVKKVSTLSQRALKQIEDKKYYEAYLGKGKRILLLGLGFFEKELHGRVKEI